MLSNYTQYNPEKIVFGRDCERSVADEIRALGCSRVLVHHDAGDFIKPLVSQLVEQLERAGLTVFTLGGV